MTNYRWHYPQADKPLADLHGDEMPWCVSDLALAVYLVLTIVLCIWSA